LAYVRVDIKSREQIVNDARIMSNEAIQSRIADDFPISSLSSDFVVINRPKSLSPHTNQTNPMQKPMRVRFNLKNGAPKTFESISVYRLNEAFTTMFKIESKLNEGDDVVEFETLNYGSFVAKIETNYASLIIGLSCAAIFLALIGVSGVVLYKNPKYFRRFKYTACNAKRSMADTL
jgi:hypothetical protein